MKFLSLLTLVPVLMTALPAQAQTQTIKVHGVEFPAKEISYFVGTQNIHSFSVLSPVMLPFKTGNRFAITTSAYLDRDGRVSTIISEEENLTPWLLPNGTSQLLDCRPRVVELNRKLRRVVGFHPNGEYRTGCAAVEPISFKDANGGEYSVTGEIEVSPSFQLVHASKVVKGFLPIGGKSVELATGSDINFHKNGQPRFFKIKMGETFTIDQPPYGKLLFMQRPDREVTTKLFEDGKVERGVIANDLRHRELDINIPGGSGVTFSQVGVFGLMITEVILSIPQTIQVKGYKIVAAGIMWDLENGFINLLVSEPFVFKNPQSIEPLSVPAGSIVGLNKNWEIIGLRVPKPGGGI